MEQRVYSVSELNQFVKSIIESSPLASGIYVRGEISNINLHSSGHIYLSLKDETGAVRAVMFRSDASRLKFRPGNGMRVIVLGRVSVYPRDGQYQIYINEMIPDGVGSLYIAFEQLKSKLEAEGLFAAEHKKPIPRFPRNIALITSPTGAAVRDMITILGRRFPLAEVMVVPVLVQGGGAPGEIARAIYLVNQLNAADLIITGRGGGSLEDLWAFNDEGVARSIAASEIPVISAVGHEPDITIADLVADLRAATPSNAAELAVPDISGLRSTMTETGRFLANSALFRLGEARARLNNLASRPLIKRPDGYISDSRIYLDGLSQRIASASMRSLLLQRERFAGTAARIDSMSPLKVLARGYAVVQDNDDHIVRSYTQLKKGDRVRIKLSEGGVFCLVERTEAENG